MCDGVGMVGEFAAESDAGKCVMRYVSAALLVRVTCAESFFVDVLSEKTVRVWGAG